MLTSDPRPGTRDLAETVFATLDISILEASGERVVLRMPVTGKVHQPMGLLHGGASALLAEAAASLGGGLAAGPDRRVFGVELNANHLRAVRDGTVTLTAVPLHAGRSTQVWECELRDRDGQLACVARCTLLVRDA